MASSTRRLQWPQGPNVKRTNTHATSLWTKSFRPSKTAVFEGTPSSSPPQPPAWSWSLPPVLAEPHIQLALLSVLLALLVVLVVVVVLAWRWRRELLRRKERQDRKALVRNVSKRTVSSLLRALREPLLTLPLAPVVAAGPRHALSLRCVASLRAAARRRAATRRSDAPAVTASLGGVSRDHDIRSAHNTALLYGMGFPSYEQEEDLDSYDGLGESRGDFVGLSPSRRRDASEISLPLRSVATSVTTFLTRDDLSPSRPSTLPGRKRDAYTEPLSSSLEFVDLPEEDRPHSYPTLLGLCSMKKKKDETSSSTTWADVNPHLSGRSQMEEMIKSILERESRSRSQSPTVQQVCDANAAGDLLLPEELILEDILPVEKWKSPTKKPSGSLAAGDLAPAGESLEDLEHGEDGHAIPLADDRLPCDWRSALREREGGVRGATRRPMLPLLPYHRLPASVVLATNCPLSLFNAAMAPTDPLPSPRGVGDDGITLPEIVPAELRGWWRRQGEFEREASACVARARGPLRNSVAVARHLLWQLRVLKRWRARRLRRDGEGDVSQEAQEKFLEVSMCFLLALLALLARVDRVCPTDLDTFFSMASDTSDSSSDDDLVVPSPVSARAPSLVSDSTHSTPVASACDVTA